MRDPARIDPLLAKIRELWLKHPDARLLQLLMNLVRGEGAPAAPYYFYTEDDELLAALEKLDPKS